ncbi:MAG: NUDIX domain-containing protein [Pseudomonadales bacterium]
MTHSRRTGEFTGFQGQDTRDDVVRHSIRAEVESIQPFDEVEARSKSQVLDWIDTGVELCRLEKPAKPPMHLVSYFLVVDGPHLLLVDHINAKLWLPTGGHVEPEEHPRDTVVREALEELSLGASFLCEHPVFLTVTETVGLTAGHTDVSLWYLLQGDRLEQLEIDGGEFNDVRWFHRDEVPLERSDPHMGRFLAKLYPRRG